MSVTWSGIVKIQLPVFPHGATNALIYSENRTIEYMQDPLPSKLAKIVRREGMKAFFHAELDGGGILTIGKKAKWQDW